MATQQKIDTVSNLTDKINKATSMVFADYRGIKHKQLEDLRKSLKKTNAEFVVTKNRLLLRALGSKAETVKDTLRESTATLFAYADEVAPLKELLKFFKTAGFGKTKAGLLGSQLLDDRQIIQLSLLPSKEVLLSKLVSQLNAPIQGLHYALSWNINRLAWALNAISGKKTT